MPIIEMKKVYLLGHRQEREAVFNLLHRLGTLELVDVKSSEAWDEFQALLEPETASEELTELEHSLSSARYCLDFLQRYFPVRKSFVQQFTGSKLELSPADYRAMIADLEKVQDVFEACRKAEDSLVRIRNQENQARNLIEELRPWADFPVPLEYIENGPRCIMGLYTTASDRLPDLVSSLKQTSPDHLLIEVAADSDAVYFFYAGLVADESNFREIFKEFSVSPVSFPEARGTPAEITGQMEAQLEALAKERNDVLAEIEGLLEYRSLLMACHDFLDSELQKHGAAMHLARTKKAFLLEGWVPAPVVTEMQEAVMRESETTEMVFRDPLPDEEVPVLIHNSGPVEAYEVVTKLYSTPRRSEVDPTPLMAPFFFVFFGICLSDAGYGVILSLLAFFVSRKLRLEGMGKQLVYLLFLGGISSIVFGLLLGSYFGDLIKLPPLWFDPLEEPMRMLFYCFAVGLFHIYFGMAVQAYRNVKAGKALSALFDQGFWFIFLNGLILLLVPGYGYLGQWLAIGGAAGLILTQGRSQSGIVMKFLSGLLSLYNITGYLSDVLSYSRLLALGLASVVIATAINAMGEMVAGSVIGFVVMVLLLAGGHLFNIVISTLSSYVHTSRLQYIEFFSKFFEGGGRSFKPFRPHRNYVDIIEDHGS